MGLHSNGNECIRAMSGPCGNSTAPADGRLSIAPGINEAATAYLKNIFVGTSVSSVDSASTVSLW